MMPRPTAPAALCFLICYCLLAMRLHKKTAVLLSLVISNTDISMYSLISKNLSVKHLLFSVLFNLFYLKLLMPQGKFSVTRKFTLRYQ